MFNEADAFRFRDIIFTRIREMLLSSNVLHHGAMNQGTSCSGLSVTTLRGVAKKASIHLVLHGVHIVYAVRCKLMLTAVLYSVHLLMTTAAVMQAFLLVNFP